jgi:DNA-directed RNA polymerase subunit M/transcription elongation factor TFIIS
MIEVTDNLVLMKCRKCGYEELVPQDDLDKIRVFTKVEPKDDHILCPFCLNDMFRKQTDNN